MLHHGRAACRHDKHGGSRNIDQFQTITTGSAKIDTRFPIEVRRRRHGQIEKSFSEIAYLVAAFTLVSQRSQKLRLLVIRRSCISKKIGRNPDLTWGKIDARPQLFDQLLQSSSTQTDSQLGRKDHRDKSLLDLRVAALLSS